MKLEATCNECGRRFLLSQILDEPEGTGGRCPFCGFHFARHYTSVLPEVVREAEASAQSFYQALDRLRYLNAGFTVDIEALMKKMTEELGLDQEHASA